MLLNVHKANATWLIYLLFWRRRYCIFKVCFFKAKLILCYTKLYFANMTKYNFSTIKCMQCSCCKVSETFAELEVFFGGFYQPSYMQRKCWNSISPTQFQCGRLDSFKTLSSESPWNSPLLRFGDLTIYRATRFTATSLVFASVLFVSKLCLPETYFKLLTEM